MQAKCLYIWCKFAFFLLFLIQDLNCQQPEVNVSGGGAVLNGVNSAQFTCQFTKAGIFQTLFRVGWNKYDTGAPTNAIVYTNIINYETKPSMYPNPIEFPENKYSMTTDNLMTGSCVFTIKSIVRDDEAEYYCTVTFLEDGKSHIGTGTLYVNVPPSIVTLALGEVVKSGTVEVVNGSQYTFQCKAHAAKPAAALQWTLDSDKLDGQGQVNKTNPGDPSLWDSESTENIITTWYDHDKNLKCTAFVPSDNTGVPANVLLDVKVPPSTVKIFDLNGVYTNGNYLDVDVGKRHTISCRVEDTRPYADIVWQVNDVEPNADFDITQTTTTGNPLIDSESTITFLPARIHHRNKLECDASIEVQNTLSVEGHVMLNVNGPPDPPNITPTNSLTEGVQRPFTCKAENAFPKGDIEWRINGVNVTQNGATNTLDQSDQRYDISSILRYDPKREDNNELIRCDVIHGTDTLHSEHRLDITFCSNNVQITNCPTSIASGNILTLSCTSSSSNPASTILWFENGTKKASSHQPTFTDGKNNGQQTTLEYTTRQLMKADNGLQLRCSPSHQSISCQSVPESSPCVLNVEYPAEITEASKEPQPPVNEGAELTLTCTADANPELPEFVRWKKTSSTENLDDEYTDGTATLTFNRISRENAGYYECVADNGIGTADRSQTIEVPVNYPANISNKASTYIGANEGQNAILECIADALPRPAFTWYHHDRSELTNSTDRVSITTVIQSQDKVLGYTIKSQLNISTVEKQDYGFYRCEATSGIGISDSLTIELNGTRKPEPVQYLKVIVRTVSSVTIQWSPGYDGGKRQTFLISYRRQGGSFSESMMVDSDVTQFTFKNLTEDTSYQFRVISQNDNGESTQKLVSGDTLWLPEAPVNLLISKQEQDSLTIRWEPGDDNRKQPQWFLIEYRKLPNGEFEERKNASSSSSLHEYTIIDLVKDTGYEINLYSESVNGINSNFSSVRGSTIGDTPGPNAIIIVGVVGGVVLLIVIIILVVILCRGNPSKKNHDDSSFPLKDSNVSGNGRVGATNLNAVNETAEAPTYAQVDKSNKGKAPTYAQVDKPNKGKTPTYAHVDKAKKGKEPTYADVNKSNKPIDNEDAYDDVANLTDEKKNSNDDGKSVNDDGLVYQEVGHFKSHPTDAPPIQTEPSTEYASLDFIRMTSGKK